MIVSAGKVTSSVLTVLRFGTRVFSLCNGTRLQQEIDKNYFLPIFPTLAAKFLPLKMLTVLSFLIFPYSYPFLGVLGSIGARGCAVRVHNTGMGYI